MTIHRALAELKLIESKISNRINEFSPIGVKQKNGLVNQHIETQTFIANANSKYDSILALIERKKSLKSAIVYANSITKISVGGNDMTIADAITYRDIVKLKTRVIQHLSAQRDHFKSQLESNNSQIEANAIKLAEAAMGKDNVKITDSDVSAIVDPYLENNKFSLIDPLKVDEKINSLTDEVDSFISEIDAVLSEANALTVIEI